MAKIKIDDSFDDLAKRQSKEEQRVSQLLENALNPERDTDTEAEKLRKKIDKIIFSLEFMKDPEDALYFFNAPAEARRGTLDLLFYKLIEVVAEATDSTIADILDNEKRTPFQSEMLARYSAQISTVRIQTLLASAYTKALRALDDLKSKLTDDVFVKKYAVLYFFAKHDELDARKPEDLTEAHKEELRTIFASLDSFLIANKANENENENEAIKALFPEFIASDNPEEEAQIMRNVPAVIATIPDKLAYPLDKLNNNVWRDLEEFPRNKDGQLAFRTGRGDTSTATVIYNIKFDELEGVKLTKKLTQYDKIVYVAVHAVYRHTGSMIMSAGQIYAAMGNAGKKPSARDIKLINESLTKMGTARIFIDNTPELQVHKRAVHFSYDAPLLPFERITATINNAATTNAIRLYAELPLMTFALQRKQVTTIDSSLLDMPLSKTDQNLRLWDYFVEQISHMKNSKGKFNNKMLLETICEKCEIKTSKQRSRAIPKIEKLLRHFMKHDPPFIKSYKMLEDGVEIFY